MTMFSMVVEEIINRPGFRFDTDFPSAQLSGEDMRQLTGALIKDNPKEILNYVAHNDALHERIWRYLLFPPLNRGVAGEKLVYEIASGLMAHCREHVHEKFDEVLESIVNNRRAA